MRSIIPIYCLSNNNWQLSILSVGQLHFTVSLIGSSHILGSHILGSEIAGFDQSLIGLDGFLMQNYRKCDMIGMVGIGDIG